MSDQPVRPARPVRPGPLAEGRATDPYRAGIDPAAIDDVTLPALSLFGCLMFVSCATGASPSMTKPRSTRAELPCAWTRNTGS